MVETSYPKAAARLAERCPDEPVMWMGAPKLRYVAPFFLILAGLGVFILLFGLLWDAYFSHVLQPAENAPWIMGAGLGYLSGANLGLYVAGAALLLTSLAAIWAVTGTCYALTAHHAWVLAKSGRGMVMDFPLKNVCDIRVYNLDKTGAGDVELRFATPLRKGKMQRRSLTFTAVSDACAVEHAIYEHLTRKAGHLRENH